MSSATEQLRAPVAHDPGERPFSESLRGWLAADHEHTLGTLLRAFSDKSFAVLFVVLLAMPALPLPTGGLTHIFEIVTMLVALELIAGRREVWMPQRWHRLSLDGASQQRFIGSLTRLVARLERISRPRLRRLLRLRIADRLFGLAILVCAAGAFIAPPFSGLDTLPALGGVTVSIGVLLEDLAIVALGAAFATGGIALELILGTAAYSGITGIL